MLMKASWSTVSYALQLLVVAILAVSVMRSDPLENGRKQWLLPNKIWLTRLIDPLTQKIKWDTENSPPSFTLTTNHKNKDTKNMHEFFEKYTFTEETTTATFEDVAKNPLSPITRAMLLMGCYGNLHGITSKLALESLTKESNAVLFNIMLNLWETRPLPAAGGAQELAAGQPGSIRNDRSVCSCLKDFASPLVANYKNGAETPYTHDTCTAQGVVDYTRATKENEDPMLVELNAYFKTFESKYFQISTNAQFNASNAWKNVSISVAKSADEAFSVFMNVLQPNAPAMLVLGDLKTHLDDYVLTKMYSHNKLRTPKYSSVGDLSKTPPEMNAESYEIYMQKYRSAYQVCALMGVQSYQTKPILKVTASKYEFVGTCFLLLATLVGFSTVFRRKIFESKEEDANKSKKYDGVMKIITSVFKSVLILFLIFALASVSTMDDDNTREKENAVRFVIFLLWVLGVVSGVLSVYDSYEDFNDDENSDFPSHLLVWKQIGQDVPVIAGLSSIAVAFRLQRGDSDEYVFLASFSLFLVLGLLQHMSNLVRMIQQYVQEQLRLEYKNTFAPRQIVPIAPQATFFDDDKVAQKDEEPPEQSAPKDEDGHGTWRIAYNRVLVTFIVAIGLVAYLTIASSTIQVWTPDVIYAEQHTRLFAFCAFFIFSAYDIFFEILVAVKYEQADLEQQHPRKMMWTSWTIIVSIFFLKMHQFFGLCYSREDMAEDSACKIWNHFFN
jgi:Ca2+/Na+ antiporter